MPRVCPLCHHSDRENLARDLLTLPYRQISDKYSVRIATISAHVHKHLPAPWSRIVQSERNLATDKLCVESVRVQLDRLKLRLDRTMAVAEAAKDHRTVLHAAEQIRRVLQVVGRITGEIPLTPVAVQNISGERLSIEVVFQLPPGNIDNSAGSAIIDVSDTSREVQPPRAIAPPKPN
jgi:hypothetical protein